MNEKITLLIADDHEVVRRGLVAFLQTAKDIEILDVAANGLEVVEKTTYHAPDIVLLDLLMPGQDALQTVHHIKRLSPRTQIIVLTSYEGDEYLVPIIQAGVISYILKDIAPNELITTIRKAAVGEATINENLAKALVKLSTKEQELHDGLTDREMEVLHCLAEGLSNQNIALKLNISQKTVKSHVSNILSKLYLHDRTQAAIYAWKQKLVE